MGGEGLGQDGVSEKQVCMWSLELSITGGLEVGSFKIQYHFLAFIFNVHILLILSLLECLKNNIPIFGV
jgi:hypothetical protein